MEAKHTPSLDPKFVAKRLDGIEEAYRRAMSNRATAYRRPNPDCRSARVEHERADRALDKAEALLAELRAAIARASGEA